MPGLYVPDDWDEGTDGFCTVTLTVPNSSTWRSAVRGAVWELALVSHWDADTGDVDQASETALDIFNSLNFDCP